MIFQGFAGLFADPDQTMHLHRCTLPKSHRKQRCAGSKAVRPSATRNRRANTFCQCPCFSKTVIAARASFSRRNVVLLRQTSRLKIDPAKAAPHLPACSPNGVSELSRYKWLPRTLDCD